MLYWQELVDYCQYLIDRLTLDFSLLHLAPSASLSAQHTVVESGKRNRGATGGAGGCPSRAPPNTERGCTGSEQQQILLST